MASRVHGNLLFFQHNGKLQMEDNKSIRLLKEQVAGLSQELESAREEIFSLEGIEVHYHSILEASPNPIVLYDMEGKVVYLNPAFTLSFGWTLEEVAGKKMDFVPKENLPETMDAIARVFKTGQVELETRRYTKDGKILDIALSCGVFKNQKGSFTGTFVLLRDVTQRKNDETRIQKLNDELKNRTKELESLNRNLQKAIDHAFVMTQEAKQANQAKSEFLANMSHEIRTPMNGVIGMTNILLDERLSPETRDGLNLIQQSAETLLTILNDILDFSKIEAGKLDVEEIDFNLRDLVDETLGILAMRSQEKQLGLTSLIDDDVPSGLTGDPGRVRQILMNLVGNAIKFTDHGGKIHLRVGVTQAVSDPVEIEFRITDTGIGMTQKDVQKLFQSFHQVDASTTRKYGGTGLGLVISKQLCELMGGKIRVKSRPGVGSTFTFTILFKKQEGETDPPKGPLPERAGKRMGIIGEIKIDEIKQYQASILVVEDHPVNQKVVQSMLRKLGFCSHAVSDGCQALEELEKTAYDLVLMDVQMPVMDGYDCARKIRAKKSTVLNPKIPIIALTAHAMLGDREKCLRVGMNDYTTKPLDRLVLAQKIKKLLFEGKETAALFADTSLVPPSIKP